MKNFYVTFGVKYHREDHPWWGGPIPHNGYLVIKAEDESSARDIVLDHVGKAWAFIYPEERFWDLKPEYIGTRMATLTKEGRESE